MHYKQSSRKNNFLSVRRIGVASNQLYRKKGALIQYVVVWPVLMSILSMGTWLFCLVLFLRSYFISYLT